MNVLTVHVPMYLKCDEDGFATAGVHALGKRTSPKQHPRAEAAFGCELVWVSVVQTKPPVPSVDATVWPSMALINVPTLQLVRGSY
jgi:hypothetical protein